MESFSSTKIIVAIDGSGSMRYGQSFQKAAYSFVQFTKYLNEKVPSNKLKEIKLDLILFSDRYQRFEV